MIVSGGVDIVPVGSKAELDRFIRVPMRLGARDPNYIAPLILERGESLTPKGNPFFEHADVQFWLAVKDGRLQAELGYQAGSAPRDTAFGAALDDELQRMAGFLGVA